MSSEPVIVFGPTGAVGGAAAIEAHRRGKTVYLAMRDPKKDLKDIHESDGEERYHRIQADLSQPDTVKQAVITSGATTAFVYAIFYDTDSMRSTFAAFKEAGINHVIFLSSFTVHDPLSSEVNKRV
jgi:NAD(P)-dependent dehydrogenase (short-subunit alcohol dehydrogenase family)